MDTNKMREKANNEFDAWLAVYEKDREANGWMPIEPYIRKHMRNAFVASREAVVVELPAERRIRHAPMPDENGSYNEALENCRDAIEAQGLKVAP